ncbi:MAG: hypothetical protein EHM34_04085 [Nitrosopumilales archaeon]|nr:MAG: hypothetical protein EHM34_04085 [Nitrosopumilales archaeon]
MARAYNLQIKDSERIAKGLMLYKQSLGESNESEIIDVDELAGFLNISESDIYQYRRYKKPASESTEPVSKFTDQSFFYPNSNVPDFIGNIIDNH